MCPPQQAGKKPPAGALARAARTTPTRSQHEPPKLTQASKRPTHQEDDDAPVATDEQHRKTQTDPTEVRLGLRLAGRPQPRRIRARGSYHPSGSHTHKRKEHKQEGPPQRATDNQTKDQGRTHSQPDPQSTTTPSTTEPTTPNKCDQHHRTTRRPAQHGRSQKATTAQTQAATPSTCTDT